MRVQKTRIGLDWTIMTVSMLLFLLIVGLGITIAVLSLGIVTNNVQFSRFLALLLLILVCAMAAASATIILWQRRIGTLRRIDEERAGLLRLAYHNLGQPLTVLKWAHEKLRESAEHPNIDEIKRHLESESEAIVRLDSIFHSLQDADAAYKGATKHQVASTPLTAIVDAAMDHVRHSIEKRKQYVDMSIPKDLSPAIDSVLITGILQELLQNASDFSAEGGAIEMSAKRWKQKMIEISVRDHGIGIPAKDLPKIAQEFSRASNASAKKPDGTGLGLFIARGIIERAGGTFSVVSEEGKGTTVSFTLPLEK